jgi:acetoacetate decarboxylase
MSEQTGFLFPRTPTGASSILPPPPWHYSGDLLTVEYRTDPAAVASLLPKPLLPVGPDDDPGAVAVVFADWQSCGPDFAELDDPIRAQYKEAFVVVRCQYEGTVYSRCVYIWVDKDFSMVRGHFQGYPKKLGSVWMTRPVTIGKAGPRLQPGGRFAGTVGYYDRRILDVRVTLTGHSDNNGFVNGHPMLHSRLMPSIAADGTDSLDQLVTMRGVDVELGQAWKGEAQITINESPVEELSRLTPIEMIGGYWRSVGTTFVGGTLVSEHHS